VNAPIIAADDLHTYYGESHILRGVSLVIAPGETVGLMGRNGMGKTTLIKSLLGLVATRSGRVRIDGADMTGAPPFRIAQRGIAYVPEGRGIFATLRVMENLTIAERPGIDGTRHWTVERICELFPRLRERASNMGYQLSGGEQQMLAIGRALLTNPRLLVLDEATEGLAPLVREEIWRTIRLVRSSGIATLVVDKTVSEVAAVADRVVVLVKGETAFQGKPADLLGDHALMQRTLGV